MPRSASRMKHQVDAATMHINMTVWSRLRAYSTPPGRASAAQAGERRPSRIIRFATR